MKDITLTPVESSLLTAIGHDAETQTLAIKFKLGGSVYHYANFSAEDYEKFSKAESVGSHFIKNIKSNPAKYPFTKVNP